MQEKTEELNLGFLLPLHHRVNVVGVSSRGAESEVTKRRSTCFVKSKSGKM